MKWQTGGFQALMRLAMTAALAVGVLGMAIPAQAAPIKIAVIAPVAITPGKALVNGAKLAADDINRAGGINGRKVEVKVYDDKISSSGAVTAMRKAVQQDHVDAVTGVFLSEAALALMPYAQRLDVPLIVESGTTKIGEMVHHDYKRYRNVFQLQLNSYFIAQEVCDAAHSLLVKRQGVKHATAVIMSEEAAWTKPLNKAYEQCLPKAGFKVEKQVNYAVNTQDFGPIYNKIKALNPTVIVTGMAHTGMRPVVQWYQNQVPALMMGFNMQAGTGGFWDASNKAAQGVIVVTNGAGGAPVTPKTPAFYKAYVKQFNEEPMLSAYTSYDAVQAVAQAIRKSGSTKTAKIVDRLESMNMDGVTGRIQFYGRHARFAHALKYGQGKVTGVAFQWQDGKQKVVWPEHLAQGKLVIPGFVSAN